MRKSRIGWPRTRQHSRRGEKIRSRSARIDQLVRAGENVTRFPGIGKGIAHALREIVFSGTLGQVEMPLVAATPEMAALNEYPALDPKMSRW